MRRIILAAVALATAFTGLALIQAPADAAPRNKNCVTKAEFRRIDEGDSLSRVRRIAGSRGRTTSSNSFSDGDTWRTVNFKQCGKSWRLSAISVSFESTEYEEWIPNEFCYDDYDYNGYYIGQTCEDYGWYETGYRNPMIVTSKSAYWF